MTILTDRDKSLIGLIAHYGMLSTGQVSFTLFRGVRKTTLLRRLRLLEKENLIRRTKALANGGSVWLLTRKGEINFGFEDTAPSINRNTIEHDLTLIDVRIALERLGLGENWISEQTLRRQLYSHEQREQERLRAVPDAIFSGQIGEKNKVVAIEVEMSPKTLLRYERIFERYSTHRTIWLLWYFVPNESFGNGLLKRWYAQKRADCSTHFAFSLISEFMSDPRTVKMQFQGSNTTLEHLFRVKCPAHTSARGLSTRGLEGA